MNLNEVNYVSSRSLMVHFERQSLTIQRPFKQNADARVSMFLRSFVKSVARLVILLEIANIKTTVATRATDMVPMAIQARRVTFLYLTETTLPITKTNFLHGRDKNLMSLYLLGKFSQVYPEILHRRHRLYHISLLKLIQHHHPWQN